MDKLAKVSLAAHEAVWHATLAAERGEEDDHLDGVNVVSNHDKLGLLLFDELGHVVETELNVNGLGTFLGRFVSSGSCEALFLLGAGLGAVFSEQFKELTGCSYKNRLLINNSGKFDSKEISSRLRGRKAPHDFYLMIGLGLLAYLDHVQLCC